MLLTEQQGPQEEAQEGEEAQKGQAPQASWLELKF
jgi:hypothetical protein